MKITRLTRPPDSELLDRAMAACHRWITAEQPSRHLSSVDGDVITLRNIRGVLAQYRYRNGNFWRIKP